MRRQKHLQELQHKALQAQYRAEKQNEREESGAPARHGGSTHTDSVRERARERKAKRGLKVECWDYMVSLPNPKRSARSARLSASPTQPCPSARVPRGPHGRLAPVPQGCNRPCSQAFPQQERPFPSRQIPKLTIFCTIHSAKF